MKRALSGLAALVAALAITAGCGNSSGRDQGGMDHGGTAHGAPTAAATAGATHNAADVTFAQMMIVHHRQAVDMAMLAPTRAGSPEVGQLAARIEAAQGPEIETMTAWLRAWDATPAPTAGMDHGGMGHGSMPGMMTTEDMARLRAARGAEFDRLFLTMMIKHHEGAVAMAKTVLEDGASRDAGTVARSIITSQSAEIGEMKAMLG
jgi:uncharacterized protein (DUF305 family)